MSNTGWEAVWTDVVTGNFPAPLIHERHEFDDTFRGDTFALPLVDALVTHVESAAYFAGSKRFDRLCSNPQSLLCGACLLDSHARYLTPKVGDTASTISHQQLDSTIHGAALRLPPMQDPTEKFATKLKDLAKDQGFNAKKRAKSGVDVGALRAALIDFNGGERVASPEAVRMWLAGEKMPRAAKLQLIADFFRVNVPWLRDDVGPKYGQPINGLKDPQEERLLYIWRNTNDQGRDAFVTLMKLLEGGLPKRKHRKS